MPKRPLSAGTPLKCLGIKVLSHAVPDLLPIDPHYNGPDEVPAYFGLFEFVSEEDRLRISDRMLRGVRFLLSWSVNKKSCSC